MTTTRTSRSGGRQGRAVVGALGHTREEYDAAGAHWTPMLRQDIAVATLYGQLFAHAADLPRKPA